MMLSVPWYIVLLQFAAGLFLANGVPHFVQGISGNPFPDALRLSVGDRQILSRRQCAVGIP